MGEGVFFVVAQERNGFTMMRPFLLEVAVSDFALAAGHRRIGINRRQRGVVHLFGPVIDPHQ